ncbi:unnamed protein product [Adineta ricciae]|uniref:EGF-like domain-containing protein n=1 Tax=Adineta ricciae TaxID=249248 RepID=A0A813TTT7_ADIRI|nr:unnamed protein product [Adineta ricciae]
MNDATILVATHTKKYNVPLNHIDDKYIQQCTDGIELEQIYKELIGGDVGAHPLLEQLTVDRIRNVRPNSDIVQHDRSSSEKSLQSNNYNAVPSIPVMSNENQQTVPKSADYWENHAQNVANEFSSDDENESTKNESNPTNKRLHLARQYFLNANTAYQSGDYQHAVDLYTKSLAVNENVTVFFNRALAYAKLNDYDGSIRDCFQILTIDPNHVNALCQRALCYCAKQQYDEAEDDIEFLQIIDSQSQQAKDLSQIITTAKHMNNGQNTPLKSYTHIQSLLNTSLNIEDEPNNNNTRTQTTDETMSLSVNNIPYTSLSQSSSPVLFEDPDVDQFQTSTINDDDDDDMALGFEAGIGISTNISDEDGRVSPQMDDDSDVPELINQKPLYTPPNTPLLKKDNPLEHGIGFSNRSNHRRNAVLTTNTWDQTNDNHYVFNENYHTPKISQQVSTFQHNTTSFNLPKNTNEIATEASTVDEIISSSKFGSLIQNWLRDLLVQQSTHRQLTIHDRPWTNSVRPWSLNNIQHDIDRFSRLRNYPSAIEVSKKMLHNGVLDYHYHAEYITEALGDCAECYLQLKDYKHAIQYATEALQYNRTYGEALLCRAKAFEQEKLLTIRLNSTDGDTWREQLPTSQDDDELFFLYLKRSEQSYDWHQMNADQFYLDACFVLAIRCYTRCIELQPDEPNSYLKRAACYLKVHEAKKAIDDCDVVLKEDPTNTLALYRKALGYKMSRDDRLYELTLKEYLKLQPNNQIVLTEYYGFRHEKIPRKKRRIRIHSSSSKSENDSSLSYEDLEQIREEDNLTNSPMDLEHVCDLKEQCSAILHSFHSIDLTTKRSIEIVINVIRVMIQAEQTYQLEHQLNDVPYSYIKYAYDILLQLAALPHIDVILPMIDDSIRIVLDEELEYYSSTFDDSEKLNRLRSLSYNQPKLSSCAQWNIDATTFANKSSVGTTPHGIFIDADDTFYYAKVFAGSIMIRYKNSSSFITRSLYGTLFLYTQLFVTTYGDIYYGSNETGCIYRLSHNGTANKSFVTQFEDMCHGLFIDLNNTLYCSLKSKHKVVSLSLDTNTSVVTTVAGNGTAGSTSVQLSNPYGIFVTSDFDLYIADSQNNRIQLFRQNQRNASTVAKNAFPSNLTLTNPTDVIVDGSGCLFIVDNMSHRIVRVVATYFYCVAGCSGVSGMTPDLLYKPYSIRLDSAANMYVTDEFNHQVSSTESATTSAILSSMPVRSEEGRTTAQTISVRTTGPVFTPLTCSDGTLTGFYCNVSNLPCDTIQPCENNGTCMNNNTSLLGYFCSCLPYINGTHCQFDHRLCKPDTCLNNGICTEVSNNTFVCRCVGEWEGGHCETRVNYCANIECFNRGVCRSLYGNYTCECLGTSYSGVHCEITADRVQLYRNISKSFAYVVIIIMSSVAIFIVLLDILKFRFGIDPARPELDWKDRQKRIKKSKQRIAIRFRYIN